MSTELAPQIVRASGKNKALLICDHASCFVPPEYASLGLSQSQLEDHIGWDIGAALLAQAMSERLDAPLVMSFASRLLIDANRHIGHEGSIPKSSGGVMIPGNQDVGSAEAKARADRFFWPYHHAISSLLDERLVRGQATELLSIHSFTPHLLGDVRPWHAGMLYDAQRYPAGTDCLAQPILRALGQLDPTLILGDNQPYQVTEHGDYSMPVHGTGRGMHEVTSAVLIEVRNDGLRQPKDIERWADLLVAAYRQVSG